ncbi:MAG TPA: cobalamin biosynthesis protein CbiM [Lentisphaeria bacterium]|nr:MAG: cobalamin biosynthesis protein CbiM [Lentisphaerae bacterium GWF2_50_93]HCE46983.1 cobalamin biosynthesis protein CbiM [Lentisphaeria bacterium]
MHMSDALLSPAVGGAFWLAAGGLVAYSARKISAENDNSKTALMGVAGAFIFAAQMINFTIPGTGSSGHLGGGLILAALLGPYRAFITLASVLVIQCLFFADGGLLALGCNIFNLAFFPAFIAYPYIYRVIAGAGDGRSRLAAGCMAGAVAGLLMGAFSVVVQTTMSGISDLSFTSFLLFMLPIHLAIGIVEGVVSFLVISFVMQAQPDILPSSPERLHPSRHVLAVFAIAALITGGVISSFASSNPDGLEWSITKVTGKEELEGPGNSFEGFLASVQDKLAFLPDYAFKSSSVGDEGRASFIPANIGTSVAGVVGGLMVFSLAGLAGATLRNRWRRRPVDA